MFYRGNSFSIEQDELGDTWQLEGIVIGNGHDALNLVMPDGNETPSTLEWFKPTVEELEAWMKQSDDPVMKLYHDGDSTLVKAVVRKATRQLDQAIVWKVYQRDRYTCVYCGITGVPLTYDHFLAQAYGGQTTLENGRTSCRPCNKKKGHMTISEWKAFAHLKGLNDGATVTT